MQAGSAATPHPGAACPLSSPTLDRRWRPRPPGRAALRTAPQGAPAGLTERRGRAGRGHHPRRRGPAAARAVGEGPAGRRPGGLGSGWCWCMAARALSRTGRFATAGSTHRKGTSGVAGTAHAHRRACGLRPALAPPAPPTWRSASPCGPSAVHSAQCVLQNSANTWHSSSAASSAPGAPLARSAATRAGSAPASCSSSGCSSSGACSTTSVTASTAAGSSTGLKGCPRAASPANSSSAPRPAR